MIGRTNVAAGGSGKSEILVTAPTGSTVTCTQDSTVKTAAEKNGVWTFKNCDLGLWTITATKNGQTAARTVAITEEDQRMRYYVTISYFSATIAVTAPAGSTVTCEKGGQSQTAAATDGSCTFAVTQAGSYTITATDGTDTASQTVTITESGQSVSLELSYGLTIVPNNIDFPTSVWAIGGSRSSIDVNESDTVITIVSDPNGAKRYVLAPVDVTNYSTLTVVATRTTTTESSGTVPSRFGLHSSQSYDDFVLGFSQNLGNGANGSINETYDISALTGTYYFGASNYQAGSTEKRNTTVYTITSVILS